MQRINHNECGRPRLASRTRGRPADYLASSGYVKTQVEKATASGLFAHTSGLATALIDNEGLGYSAQKQRGYCSTQDYPSIINPTKDNGYRTYGS